MAARSGKRASRWSVLAGAVAAAAALGGVAWGVSDRLEARNDFCNSCHLPSGTPLHLETRRDFDRIIPITLSGAHGRGLLEERDDAEFRCIDCHAGVGVGARLRVKLLAGWDAARYAVGRFEEPKGMPWPLGTRDCRRCHPDLRGAAPPGWGLDAYHGLAAHDEQESVACVACHVVHERGGDAFAFFLLRDRVESGCLACHPDGSDDVY